MVNRIQVIKIYSLSCKNVIGYHVKSWKRVVACHAKFTKKQKSDLACCVRNIAVYVVKMYELYGW